MPIRRLLLLALLLPLPGCESAATRALRASPDYKAGYSDGCGSATNADGANAREDGMRRDDDAYQNNRAYRSGWGTGYGACRMSQPGYGQPGAPDHSITADPNPGMP